MKNNIRRERIVIAWVAIVCALVLGAFARANAQSVLVSEQMGPGDTGAQVSALQTFLAANPSVYPEGLVTGYYGSLTTAAVQKYQCTYGIVCSGGPASTGYGQVGPMTLAKIESQEGTSGGAAASGATALDAALFAPIVSAPTVATSTTSATIQWTTNQPAQNSVMYGTTWPFLYATAPSVSNAMVGNAPSVTITGLSPNTTYYYVLQSVNTDGNLQWSIDHSFTTGA